MVTLEIPLKFSRQTQRHPTFLYWARLPRLPNAGGEVIFARAGKTFTQSLPERSLQVFRYFIAKFGPLEHSLTPFTWTLAHLVLLRDLCDKRNV